MFQRQTMRQRAVVYIGMAALIVVYLFPIYWTLLSSFKPTRELVRQESYWPNEFTLSHYQQVLDGTPFVLYLRNSLVVALGTVVITVVLASTAAYSLSRMRFHGRKLFGQLILVVYLFPGILLIIPAFGMLLRLRLYDTFMGLILFHVLYTLPFGVWTLKTFFDGIPTDLDDAARVDGASRLTILRKVYIPLARPGMATAALFAFVISWNEYLFAAVMVQSTSRKTLPVGIAEWSATYSIDWGQITSASILTIIPVIVFFAGMGRFFVQGLTAGAVRE